MKSVYFGIVIGALALLLVIVTRSKADPVPAGTVFDQIVDVRTPEEFREDRVQGAMNINVLEKSFHEEISKLERDKVYAVYCRSGARSSNAKSIMTKLGFKNVINLGSLAQAKKSAQREGK
jgi:rhodanese-related sulfurtransferase